MRRANESRRPPADAKDRMMSKGHAARRPSAVRGDASPSPLQDVFSALIQEAHAQRKSAHAARTSLVSQPARGAIAPDWIGSAMLPDNLKPLLRESHPTRRLSDLVLQKPCREELREFLGEVAQTELLRSHSLEPRHTVLLIGPPGTGKTSLASAIATELALPFLTVRYEGLVGSYLGETAGRLQEIVDYVARTPCVLFFDEFDSVGKERADTQETGEIKRVVSSLLLHMDALPSHCIVICATNHPELLDRAVWRRFELRLELPKPGAAELKDWYLRTERLLGSLGFTVSQFIELFEGETFSEIEAITLDARRKVVLSRGAMASEDAFRQAVARWERRRRIGGGNSGGERTNRKARARAQQAGSDSRPAAALPPRDLLS
jgi:SpoVK/Ycf46/Vps4 family AAA+-type ATPase